MTKKQRLEILDQIFGACKSTDLESLVFLVTPEVAVELLKLNHPDNRDERYYDVDRFVTAMKMGDFILTHQGVAFNKEGYLCDGQHRLMAIVKSGLSQRIQVSRNLEKRAQEVMDTPTQRTMANNLRYAKLVPKDLSTRGHVATANAMISGHVANCVKYKQISQKQMGLFICRHQDGIRFAHKQLPQNSPGGKAAVRAVVARAHGSAIVDLDRLCLFCECLRYGVDGRDSNEKNLLRLFRDCLMKKNNDGKARADLYGLTQHVLKKFLGGKVKKEEAHLPKEGTLDQESHYYPLLWEPYSIYLEGEQG